MKFLSLNPAVISISLLGLIFGRDVVGLLETGFLSNGSRLDLTVTLVFSGSIGP